MKKSALTSYEIKAKIRHWVKTRFKRTTWGWVESIIMTLLILAAGFYLSPSDPFFIHAPFPWTWLAPILIALRYGVGPAFLSVMIIVAIYAYAGHYGSVDPSLYKVYFLGGLITTLLCGEFSAQWAGRVRRSDQLSAYAEERLENLSKVYFVTRISHDRLEQNLISKPTTLRNTLESMRGLLAQHGGKLDKDTAHHLLLLLSQHCSLTCAAIFPVRGNVVPSLKKADTLAQPEKKPGLLQKLKEFHLFKKPFPEKEAPAGEHAKFFNTSVRLSEKSIAFIGPEMTLDSDDILVQKSLEAKQLTYFSVGQLSEELHSQYLVSVPLCSGRGVVYGVLVVKDMPFLSLNFETLQVLTILIAYYSYELSACRYAKDILKTYPTCPPDFAAELIKLLQLKQNTETASSMVAMYIKPNPLREDIILQHRRQVRGLDFLWHTQENDTEILMTLMPFSNISSVEGYLNRIERWLKEVFGITLGKADFIQIHYTRVHGLEPCALIAQLLEQTNET